MAVVVGLLVLYLVLPWLARPLAADAGNFAVNILRQSDRRTGAAIAVDRQYLYGQCEEPRLALHSGETVRLTGVPRSATGTVSLRGYFQDANTVSVDEIHFHPTGVRDAASMIGLALVALSWMRPFFGRHPIQGNASSS
jgi:hypothetical protein